MKYLKTTIIYIALRADGLRKLGSCRHVGNRQKSLQSEYGMKYEVEETWQPDVPNALTVELMAHALIDKKYREMGEHYRTSKKVLMRAVNTALKKYEQEWRWGRTMHGLAKARERGVIGGQPSPFSDKKIRQALRKAKTISGASKILKCAKITIQRRLNEWEAIKQTKKAKAA